MLIYQQFILYLQKKQGEYPLDCRLQKHHIIPKHVGGFKHGPIVYCTPEEHRLAHFYRFLSYGDKYDQLALFFMAKQDAEARHLNGVILNEYISEHTPLQRSKAGKLGARARIEKQKRDKTNLFDPTYKMQRKGNLVRWGVIIDGVRVPYKELSSDFVDDYLLCGAQKSEHDPLQRKAGEVNEQALIEKPKRKKVGIDPAKNGRKGCLVRWGLINGVLVPYEELSSEVVDNSLLYGTPNSPSFSF